MAIFHHDEQRDYDLGHGTRAGFRYVSLFGIIAFLLLLSYFIWGPRQAATDPAATATENTQVEEQAAPQPQPPAAPQAQPEPTPPQPATP